MTPSVPAWVLAVPTALLAAMLLGSASVVQRRAAAAVPVYRSGDVRLVGRLFRSPWWWGGTLAALAGSGLQIAALSIGSIILVQSTMTSSIVFTTIAEWVLLRHRPSRRAWTGMAMTATGLAAVLLALAPAPGPADRSPSATETLALLAASLAVMAGILVRARRRPALSDAVSLALATGIGYGVTAIQLKAVDAQLAAGWLAPLGHPALYAAVIIGPLSILLSQQALQQGRLVVPVVAVILVVDPLVGLAAGVSWFGEHVSTAPDALAVTAAGAVAVVLGMARMQAGRAVGSDAVGAADRTAAISRP